MRAFRAAVLLAVLAGTAAGARAEIASAVLQIDGISLELESVAVTTGIDMPVTVQTRFGGKKNEDAPAVEGLLAAGDLVGPGIQTPITLTTAPGHRFHIPGLAQQGVYYLQNVRLMKGSEFVLPATPSAAAITVADLLQTSVTVRQLTPDELRARGIVLDGRNFDVYEYSFTFLVDGQTVEVPYPVAIDSRTREVTPIRSETPYSIPTVTAAQPPRWTPPEIIPFELPPEPPGPDEPPRQVRPTGDVTVTRPRIPAAIVIPNSLAVLHQFFAVILAIQNGAPAESTVKLEDVSATIRLPAPLRLGKSKPAVAFGQPVPIVDAVRGVTFLVAQAKGEAEWSVEGLASGTHTIEIDVRATYREQGQEPVPLRGTPRASIVVHDPRFNITFSHPDTVRQGLDYSTYTFVTNTSPAQQTIRIANGLPHCDQNPGAHVCRRNGAETDEITLAAGETQMIVYALRSALTGRVFATAGTVGNENLSATAQLHMGVSETGVPLSPTTLLLPHYAQFLPPALVAANLQLLGLGYSVATAPVTETTAKLPRVIKTDVFQRAVDLARAGQRVFIAGAGADSSFAAMANFALDALGNAVELREWDRLRRETPSGRAAGAAILAPLSASGANVGDLVDAFAAATAHRTPYVLAIAHGAQSAGSRPYALALRSLTGALADVPNEAEGGWKRTLPFADLSTLNSEAVGRAGELALVGRWSGDLEVIVKPAQSGPVSLELIFPAAAERGLLRARLDLSATAGETLRIPLSAGASTVHALLPNGGTAAMVTAGAVAVPPLRAVAARQDLHLDPEGHKVSILFSRPVAVPLGADLLAKLHGAVEFSRDGLSYAGRRPIFAAALQDGRDIVNATFDHVLSTNATYTLAVDPLLDPITGGDVPFGSPLVPAIENDRPAGILHGRFLQGDGTPIANADIRLFSGHYRGCPIGLFEAEPPVDCNPYREAPQFARTDDAGTFLFEYVPRDPIADRELTGGYRLVGVTPGGRYAILDGAVRLPGAVHRVDLQLLGRGAAEGTVRYGDGVRVAGAKVFVGSSLFHVGRGTTSDASGNFRIDDLPVGPISFSAADALGNVTFASGEIAVPGQVARKDLVIHRQPFPGTGTVQGSVVRSDDGKPVAGARVGVSSRGHGLTEAFTGGDGRFEFRDVPAGFVTVLAAEWSIATAAAHTDFDLRADELVRLPPLILPVRDLSQPSTTVTGVVIAEDALHPGDPAHYRVVAEAVVRIGDRPAVLTGADGRFRFADVPVHWGGSVPVVAYDPATRRNARVPLPSISQQGPNDISVFLAASSYGDGLIRVRLINAWGAPVTGFRVIEPGVPPRQLHEAGQGVYEYRNAPVGPPVTIVAVGGPSLYGEQSASGTAQLSFPGQTATLTLRLPGHGTVRARLRGDIDLIGDVSITYRAWDEAEQALRPKTRTASTAVDGTPGWATFAAVPSLDDYRVESLHPVHGHAAAGGRLAFDGDLADHTLQLRRLSTVRGTVYAIDGMTPVAGAAVRIEDERRDPGLLITQPDGTFAFHDVPAGVPFRIVAEVTQSGIYRAGVAFGSTPPHGGTADHVALLLRRRGNIEGRVVYKDYKFFDPQNPSSNVLDDTPETLADNAPVPLAKLWVRELGFPSRGLGTDSAPLAADAAGRFAIPNVFVGPLRARAWDPANQELQGAWAGELSEEGEVLREVYLAIADGGTGTVVVTVVDPNQQWLPIANAEVSLFAGPLFDLATTDGTGVARFHQVPTGAYSVSAYSKALGKSGSAVPFLLERDETEAIRVLLEFSGRVSGTLTDPETVPASQPVTGAPVTLSGAGYQSRASTGTVGEFAFDGVREGTFSLDAKDAKSNRRAHATRILSAANPEPHVALSLEPTETLHLTVYLPDDSGASSGVLAPPVAVTATQRNGDYLRSAQGNPVLLSGLFRDSPYHVTVEEIGGFQRRFTATHSFPAGSVLAPLSFVYPASGTVEVRVLQAGIPASGARVRVSGSGHSVTLFTDATGRAVAQQIPLGDVAAQATSLDAAFSGSASGVLARSSVPIALDIELGAYAGVTGLVEAEEGGASIGTRVLATFAGRTLEMLTDADGRYTFQGIPTPSSGTLPVNLVYAGPDGFTVGGQQSAAITGAHASMIVTLPLVRLDATPPQLESIEPEDGALDVSPDTFLRFTFSEPIRAEQIDNAHFQLVPADGSGQLLCTFDAPAIDTRGRMVVTMRPPPAPPGQAFPLKSNTLHRIVVSGQIADLTGHRLAAPRGQTFTTSDYVEPRVIRTVPAAGVPASRSQTFEFHFNEAIDPAPWQPGGSAVFRFYKLDGAGGSIVTQKEGSAFLDPTNPARLMFGPFEPLEPESFYRAVFSGVRDLQGNALAEQTFEFVSFDETPPFVILIPPVPAGIDLVSGVEYTLGVDLRNGHADGSPATDVASLEWFRADGTAETFLAAVMQSPFAYRFVAPEAPAEGLALTLRARAIDRSGNRSEPATATFAVRPNAAPTNVALILDPPVAYPGNSVKAAVTFIDEGVLATVQVSMLAAKDGDTYADSKMKQVSRASVADPWPPTDLVFSLPPDLRTDVPAAFTATVTDVRGLSASAERELPLLADSSPPVIHSLMPAPETRFLLNQQYRVEAIVSDAETGVAHVDFVVDGQSHRALTSAAGPSEGTRAFTSPLITVPAKNLDTRVAIVAIAVDHQGNAASRSVEVIYTGVNDPAIPRAAWICPVDRASLPASSALTLPLRVRATDDIAVTSVRFFVPGIEGAVPASRVGSSDVWMATVSVTTPAAGEPFLIRADVSDADPAHTVELPIAIDLVAIDVVVDATQAITSTTLPQFENKSVLVRSGAGRLVTHVPVTFADLLVLDGGRIESLPTTTSDEHRVDLTVSGRLYVDCESLIDVRAKGYPGGWGVNGDGSNTRNDSPLGRTIENATVGGASDAGASHGGLGQLAGGGAANAVYGSLFEPSALGSGGAGAPACCNAGGAGGGAIAIRAAGHADALGRFAIAGQIRADGGAGVNGGSGGSVLLAAKQLILGDAALLSANGGDASQGAGAGGRVAVSATGRLDLTAALEQLQSRGGRRTAGGSAPPAAAAGTVTLRRPGQEHGELLIASESGSPLTRATPLGSTGSASGESLVFDSVHLGPGALARFDQPMTVGGVINDRASAIVDSTAVLLLDSDRPTGSVMTAPPAGADLIRATELEISLDAASLAGVGEAHLELSAAPAQIEAIAGYPANITGRAMKLPIPADATLGAATLGVRIGDRADRFVDLAPLAFTIVENQPPILDVFIAIPESLYPGKSVTATVGASDDVKVTRLSVTSRIGDGEPLVQSITTDSATVTHDFTIPIPITTPGGTPMTLEAAVEDGFPSRAATKQAKSITILTDTVAPALTIVEPAHGAVFQEASSATLTVRAIASDAEVGVKSVTVRLGAAAPVAMSRDGDSGWQATLAVPNVDGADPVSFTLSIAAADYENNIATAEVEILVLPLIDPAAPALRWACGATGALFPAGSAARLRVMAKGATSSNGVQKVEFFIGSSPNPLLAAAVSGMVDHYEVSWPVPDLPDGTPVDVRVVATSVAGNQSDIVSRVTIVKSNIPAITANTTIDASNAAVYSEQTVIVTGGTLTIAGEQTFQRLVVLGGSVTHPAGGSNALRLHVREATFVACGASLDVTGRGWASNTSYPGALQPYQWIAGSHIGASTFARSGSTFGSIYAPAEAGGGAYIGTAGGGVVRLRSDAVMVEGAIRANGAEGGDRSGAGGSIWITAARIAGTGTIESRGGNAYFEKGGGGAVAIDYSDPGSQLPAVIVRGGTSGTYHAGGAGTLFVRGPASTFGALIVDSDRLKSDVTDLPALGSGTAQSGTGGSTLVTDRSSDVPPYFHGHWVEIRRGESLVGTWRVGSIAGRAVSLVANDEEGIDLRPGDLWQGVYRFDRADIRGAGALASADPIRLPADGVLTLHGDGPGDLDLPTHLEAPSVVVRGNVSARTISARDLTVDPLAVLTHAPIAPGSTGGGLRLTVENELHVRGSIDATGRGFGNNTSYPGALQPYQWIGGSHIGRSTFATSGATFGSVYRPAEGGGGAYIGTAGGGVVRIEAGSVTIDGSIRANGADGGDRAGAGGSVWITASTVAGGGVIEVRGGNAHFEKGGGGAVSIEYANPDSVLPIVNVRGGTTGTYHAGGAGSLYVRRPSSVHGDLTIDGGGQSSDITDLPSLGRGIAQGGTSGATLVTDRTADIPRYFEGHSVEITRGGSLVGMWRVATVGGRTVSLAPEGEETIALQPGDGWAGVYRLDSLAVLSAQLRSEDQLRVSSPTVIGPGSSITGNNSGPPLVDPLRIEIRQEALGLFVVGRPGAVSDPDTPVTVTARSSSGGAFTSTAALDGSFSVQIAGNAEETITLSARDGNHFPLESAAVAVGTIPGDAPAVTQISRTLWTADAAFRAQTVVADGTILAVASANVNGSASDKLVVLDTTNPAAPAHVRTIATGAGGIRDLDVVGGWAYLAANRLVTVDLTVASPNVNLAAVDPSGAEQAITVTGGYAFTSVDDSSGSIHVYDVSDPAAPRYLRTQTFGSPEGTITDLIPYGSDFLVALMDGASFDVRIIDRRNPNALVRVGSLSIASFQARRGSILGTRLYAVGPTSAELVIVDLADPANPALAARMALPAAGGGHVRIAADLGFVANGTGGLTATTIEPASLSVAGNAVTGGNAQDVAVTAGVAYVANESGIAVVPVTMAPVVDTRRISLARTAGGVTAAGGVRAVSGDGPLSGTFRNAASGDEAALQFAGAGAITATIYARGGDSLELTAADGTHAPTTRALGQAPFAAHELDVRAVIAADASFFARRLAVDGTTTLLTNGTLLGTRTAGSANAFLFRQPNASEPAQIVVGTAAGDEVNDSTARAGFGYFAGSRFSTINFLNSMPTVNAASSDPAGRQYAVALVGDTAFVAGDAGSNGSIHIYDVSSPTTPVFLRTQAMSADAPMIYRALIPLGGGRVVALSPDAGRDVTILDVSDPDALVRLAVLDVPSFSAYRGAVDGSTLYLAGGAGGIAVVDLSNPSAPQHVGTISTPGIAFSAAVLDASTVVVADGSRGLTFLDVSNRQQPVVLGSQPLEGNTTDVKVVNGAIHAATETRYFVLRP